MAPSARYRRSAAAARRLPRVSAMNSTPRFESDRSTGVKGSGMENRARIAINRLAPATRRACRETESVRFGATACMAELFIWLPSFDIRAGLIWLLVGGQGFLRILFRAAHMTTYLKI